MMKKEPSVSVIMPAYNCEKWISSAIKSIQAQTLSDWELIIVEDCSVDGTERLIQQFIEQDDRIQLIKNEKNSGPGKAKNIGIRHAKGTYITFCDTDDWIEPDAYEKMVYVADFKADVIVTGYYRDIYDNIGSLLNRSLICTDAKQYTTNIDVLYNIPKMDEQRLFSFGWNKLYRKDIINKYNIQFSDKRFGEDYDFNIEFFSYVENAIIMDQGYYHYVKSSSESLTERYVPDFYDINKERFLKMRKLMRDNHIYSGDIRANIMTAYIKHVLAAISRLYDPRGGVSYKERRYRTQRMISDEMSIEALRYAKGNGLKEKICNFAFKTKSTNFCLLFGRFLWFMNTKGQKVYEKVK